MKGRSLAVLALTAPLALTGLAVAPSALAAASFAAPTPAEGAQLTSNSFTVKANIASRSEDVTLTVTGQIGEGGSCTTTAFSQGGPLASSRTITLSVPSGACNTSRNARWTATLSGDATGTRSFSTNAAPSTPSNFDADGDGARDVAFSWTRGNEPDLLGYALYDGAGELIDGDIGLSRCNGSQCTYALYYPADNPGTHNFALAARRASAGCSGCGAEVASGRATASATLVEPPPPPPPPPPTPTSTPTGGTGGTTTTGGTSGGSTGGTSGGSTGGTTTGGSTSGGGTSTGGTTGGTAVQPAPKPTLPTLPRNLAAARRAFALSFNAFSPSLGIPKLPPLPATFAPTIGPDAQIPEGSFEPSLPYKPQQETLKTTTTVFRQVPVVGEINTADLARSIAAALILMLAAAHLRRFLGVRPD